MGCGSPYSTSFQSGSGVYLFFANSTIGENYTTSQSTSLYLFIKKAWNQTNNMLIGKEYKYDTDKLGVPLPYKELERIAGHFCDIVVSVNKYERDLSIKEKIIPEEKIITIYNGISEESFGKWNNFNDNGKNIDLKDKFGITDDSIIIGSVSRFSTQKNIIALAKAAIKIVAKNRGIKFVLIGDGPLYNDVRRLVIQAKSMDRILLPGWQTNIRQWLLVMDIFVLYSLWEGLSISILEAMAVGKPIIASNIKGNNELVIDRENGFLVPIHQNNENMLINKILTLAKNETLIESMGKRSKELVKEKFSIQQFVDAYDKVYQMLK